MLCKYSEKLSYAGCPAITSGQVRKLPRRPLRTSRANGGLIHVRPIRVLHITQSITSRFAQNFDIPHDLGQPNVSLSRVEFRCRWTNVGTVSNAIYWPVYSVHRVTVRCSAGLIVHTACRGGGVGTRTRCGYRWRCWPTGGRNARSIAASAQPSRDCGVLCAQRTPLTVFVECEPAAWTCSLPD